jgi:hypothetical protein
MTISRILEGTVKMLSLVLIGYLPEPFVQQRSSIMEAISVHLICKVYNMKLEGREHEIGRQVAERREQQKFGQRSP